ncbi:MAG: Gfo/Idh/MocA family oxidoreductase [Opitutaceae bacterium]|jgi:predicted dehydrogenase|nr:Gfo/Idh/MocA family oxidoreductase [Opitutaceae bacterium]
MDASPISPTAPQPRLRWGILSTGRIAGVFARDLATAKHSELVAVGSRSGESAQRFAQEHGIDTTHTHGSIDGLLADADVDAVYVASPHPMHLESVVAALEAGKHVLCEKPIAMSLAELDAMQAAARANDRTLMEAWMYRCHPQTKRLVELVCDGSIGELRHIQGAFSFAVDYDPAGRLWNKALGGGGILDVGGYPLSYARLLAGLANGEGFADPETMAGVGLLHAETGVDTHATAVLQFRGGVTAEIACGTLSHQQNVVRVYGTKGWILVPSPYVVRRDAGPTQLHLHRGGESEETPEVITVMADRGTYAYEADAFAAAVRRGESEVPECTWADTHGNLRGQLEWCRQLGLTYV